uniref:Selenoprotein T n=1 Tax=Salarias fasciatus TaxID=181472 RepID=A0A672GG75_SALFA
MAEYSQAGLLAALLLFTALTVRDVYLGRSSSQRPGLSPSSSPDPEPARAAKASTYSGPVLRFQYCKVFQDYSQAISQVYPDIRIEGGNYPPTAFNRCETEFLSDLSHVCLGNLISYLKLLSILLIISGQNPFLLLGLETPRAWTWSQDNKIFSCLMAFFLCNMMETHFLSTGAFEVTLNDVPVWSKLQSGYVPNIQEMFQILNNHLKMNQVDHMNFSPP